MDTIVTAINFADVNINDYSKFTANPMNLHYPAGSVIPTVSKIFRSKRNNSSGEFSDYGYLPQVSIIIYPGNGYVYLTFSVSKMLFNGSNLYEVDESDFDNLITVLHYKLNCIGIYIKEEYLRKSLVWSCHFSKNIQLKDYHLSCKTIISILNKMNSARKLAIQTTKFINADISKVQYEESEMFSLWSKKHEIVLYNKYEELAKDIYGKEQLYAAPSVNSDNLLRFEYRAFKTDKLKHILKQVGFTNTEVTFEEIFKNSVIQAVNTYIWTNFIKPKLDALLVLESFPTPNMLMDKLNKLHITGISKLNVMAAYNIYHQENGLQTLSSWFPARTNVLLRLRNIIKQIDETDWNVSSTFSYIEQKLIENKPILPGDL